MMKRVVCIYLPAWPLQRLRRARPELASRAVALYEPGGRGDQIVCAAPACVARSRPRFRVVAGMPLGEAMAVEPTLFVQPCDAAADRRALGQLAEWANRFSPIVALEESSVDRSKGIEPSSLFLDVTGCAACFGGEPKLLDRVDRELRAAGWAARVALADTAGAAWALSHYARGDKPHFQPPGQLQLVLKGLPLAALRLSRETVEWFAELGIERIGDLIELPRSSIPVRLGPEVLRRLDQALGREAEVLTPYRPPLDIESTFSFEYATEHRDAIGYAIDQLVERVCRNLEEQSAGARRLECWLHHEVAKPVVVQVGLYRPSRSVVHLRGLLRTRLERLTIIESVSAVRLRVPLAAPLDEEQPEIFQSESAVDPSELAHLVDQLSTQLGREAVARVELVPEAQPEHAYRYEPVIERADRNEAGLVSRGNRAGGANPQTSGEIFPRLYVSDLPPAACRPLRLLAEPEPVTTTSVVPDGPPLRFRWSGMDYRVERSWGPERIETGWWRGNDVHRDYFLVETSSGTRFWLFRRRDDHRWFLHGLFD